MIRLILNSLAFLVFFISCGSITIAQNQAEQNIYEVPVGGKVDVTVNGKAMEAFFSPGMPSNMAITKATAGLVFGPQALEFVQEKSGFKIFSIKRVTGAKIGPYEIKGKSEVAKFDLGSKVSDIKISWFEQDKYPFADVIAGPYAIPENIIRFKLREKKIGEKQFELPLAGKYSWWLASSRMKIDGKNVLFAFAPQFENSVASAAAGSVISNVYGGQFAGEILQTRISHNVSRPVRKLELRNKLMLGELMIPSLFVRTQDYGNIDNISERKDRDPSEIIVTAKSKSKKPDYLVYVGADALKTCSSITYDKKRKKIILSCFVT